MIDENKYMSNLQGGINFFMQSIEIIETLEKEQQRRAELMENYESVKKQYLERMQEGKLFRDLSSFLEGVEIVTVHKKDVFDLILTLIKTSELRREVDRVKGDCDYISEEIAELEKTLLSTWESV